MSFCRIGHVIRHLSFRGGSKQTLVSIRSMETERCSKERLASIHSNALRVK